MTRLFCVTVYIFNEQGDKCLFINHKKLGCWFPPGGKIDPNELPDDAAVRECLEETGVNIKLVGERAPVEGGLIRPYGMQLNTVIPGEREHIDFIYRATADNNQQLILNEKETAGIEWFDVETICSPLFNTKESVKTWVKKFSTLYYNK